MFWDFFFFFVLGRPPWFVLLYDVIFITFEDSNQSISIQLELIGLPLFFLDENLEKKIFILFYPYPKQIFILPKQLFFISDFIILICLT